MPSLHRIVLACLMLGAIVGHAKAAPLKVVSWNAEAGMYEAIQKRGDEIRALNRDLAPDVLILIEITGVEELRRIAGFLGWEHYHAVISDFEDVKDSAFAGLEVAVISKVPIASVTEYDASPEGESATVLGTFGEVIADEKELSSLGIAHVAPMAKSDRGTLRVDLDNGLTIFPVHLKANTNSACADLSAMMSAYRRMGAEVPAEITAFHESGFPKAVEDHLLNAVKRERVIAAVTLLADQAVSEGKTALVVGDFNTSFEPGKAGSGFVDCALLPYTCEKVPFPAAACVGDGYDDTFSILKTPLIGTTPWVFLTETLGRTYNDNAFADKAIDHIAVPKAKASLFTTATKGSDTYGSDHFPIMTVFSGN
jgi:endonuclease/exonuclease/phosphatase family metal-dependent hydrolase